MPSHRPKVDYTLRPGKAAVRQMVVNYLSRLEQLFPTSQYRYVGMGSIYFRDFELIHRQLAIDSMVSIEGDFDAEKRVRFNSPLSCIDVVMGSTGEVLPILELGNLPHIVWLDYESNLTPGVLADIDSVVSRCAPKSVFLATVNCSRLFSKRRQAWLSGLGGNRPGPRDPRELEEYALLSYRVVKERIEECLADRNAGLSPSQRLEFRQGIHFIHADGAQMLTVGGVIASRDDRDSLDACALEELPFARMGESACSATVPPLTRREVHRLLSSLPESHGDFAKVAEELGIPEEDAQTFASIYRFAPVFVEADGW